jgi:hypothetical protein
MPINVEGPDGSVVEFPDGIDPTVMRDAMRKKFGYQAPAATVADAAKDAAWQLPQGFNRGLDSVINAPYNLVRAGAGFFGKELPEAKPIVGQLNSGVEPQGATGRIAGTVGEAVGSSVIPSGATLGLAGRAAAPLAANAGTMANMGHTMLEGVRAAPAAAAAMDVASGVGSGLGSGIAKEAGAGPIGQTVASVVGGLAPAAFPIGKALMQLQPQQQQVQNALLDAGHRQGVPIPRAVASGDSVANAAGGISQIPIVGTPIGQGFRRGVEGTGERAAEIANTLGSGSRYEAGRVARQAIRDWMGDGSSDVNRTFYDAVNQHIPDPQATGGPLVNTRRVVTDMLQRQQASTGQADNPAIALVQDALARPNGLTYDGLRNLRTEIGSRLSGQITPEAGTNQPALQRLYGALSDDLRTTVENAGGPQALRAFNRANNVARMVASRREQLGRVIGVDGNAPPERVFDNIIQMAGTKGNSNLGRLAAARRAVGPEAWQEVQSAAIAKFGRDKDNNFSAARAISAYGDLSQGGKNAIFGRHGGANNLRQSMDDLVTISRQFDRLAKNFATGSAKTNSMLYMWDKILAGVSGAAGAAVYSNPALALPAAATAGGMIAGRQFSRYLGNPTTAQAVRAFNQAYVRQVRAQGTSVRTALNTSVRTLAQALAKQDGSNPDQVELAIQKAMAADSPSTNTPRHQP